MVRVKMYIGNFLELVIYHLITSSFRSHTKVKSFLFEFGGALEGQY